MTDGIRIVTAGPNDWKVVQKLNLEIFQFELETAEPTSNLEFPFSDEGESYFKKACIGADGYSAFLALHGDAPVGYVIIRMIPSSEVTHRVDVRLAQLHTLSVTEGYRDKGIGRQLSEAAITAARSAGANRMKVVAYAKNERARHLYRDLGFVEHEISHEIIID